MPLLGKPHHKGFAMGKVLFHLGRNIEAVRILEEAASLSKDDDNDFILELGARASFALKDPKRAFAAIEQILPTREGIMSSGPRRIAFSLLEEKIRRALSSGGVQTRTEGANTAP